MKKIFLLFLGFCMIFINFTAAEAVEDKLFGRPFSYTGYIRQEAGMTTHDNGHLCSAYSSLWFEGDYKLSDVMSFHMILNPSFDNAYNINHDKSWWNEADPYYYPRGAVKNSSHGDPYNYESGYGFSEDDMEYYHDYFLRELYADINLGPLVFRLGRQTVGWGESDGIRLSDIINPLDLSREFSLRDGGFEETRIPLWMLKTSYYPDFKLGKMTIPGIEFLVIPDIEITRLGMRNNGPVRGLLKNGFWGLPQPILPEFLSEVNFNVEEPDSWDDTEFALRIFGEIGGWTGTLNFFYGREDDFVGKTMGVGLLANVPGVGLTEVGRLTPQQVEDSGLNEATLHWLEQNGLGAGFPGIDQLRSYFDGIFGRKKIIGLTLNKEVGFLRYQDISPVMRFEGLYQFDKLFNSDGDHWGELAWLKTDGVVEKDQIRYMIGLDWPIRIPILNSRESFFTSTQFLQYIIPDYDKKLFHAPYYFGAVDTSTNITVRDPYEIPSVQNFFTFSVSTGYDNGRFKPSVLFAQDFKADCYFIHAKINLDYSMHWRQQVGVQIYGGDNRFHSFGMYDNNDQVYFRFIYQF